MEEDIVFAGTRDTWERWRDLFESSRIHLHLAEVIVPIPSKDLEEKISSIDPATISSAVFTSKNSVKILMSLQRGRDLVEGLHGLGALIAATGSGTASILFSHGYRAFSPPLESVESLLKILRSVFRGGRIAVFCSDRLEIPGDLVDGVERIEVYGLMINMEGISALRDMLRRGVRRIIVASRTASTALCMHLSQIDSESLEVHAMTKRIAEPLLRCGGGVFRLVIHGSTTFKDFIASIINSLSSA